MERSQHHYEDATLVLVGHGSTLNADSAAPTHQHAQALRERKIFGQVLTAFWKEEPSLAGISRAACGKRVFVVPLFISEGYFTEEVIPRELGFEIRPDEKIFPKREARGGQIFYYCGPVGTSSKMTDVLLARARQVVQENPFPRAPRPNETALFIAGHGTGNNENSRKAIEQQVDWVRARGMYREAHAIFMEEEPRIESCYGMTEARHIVVAPFFISDGLHSYEDIPVMLGAPERVVKARLKAGQPTWRNPTEMKGKLVWYGASVGSEALLAEVILDRVKEAEGMEGGAA